MSAPAVLGADATNVEDIEKKVQEAKKEVAEAEAKVAEAEAKVAEAEAKVAEAKKEVKAAETKVAAAETDQQKTTAEKLMFTAVTALETAYFGLKTSEEERKSQVSVLVGLNDVLNELRHAELQTHQAAGATPAGAAGGAQAASRTGAEGGTHVSVGHGDNQEWLDVLHEMREELRHVRQRIDHDNTNETISHYPVEKYDRLLQELQLSLLVVEAPDEVPQIGSASCSLFTWEERTEPQQIQNCISFLKGHLSFPRSCVLHAIDDRHDFLNVVPAALGTTMGIRGTSDIAVLDRDLQRLLCPRAGIILLFELKKAIQEKDARQAQLQVISGNVISQFRPVVVLTDLRESWIFYWIKDRSLCMMSARSASQAWDIINQMLASHSDPQRDVSAVLPQNLINRTQLRSVQKPANVSSQDENDDYQMDLLTQEEREEAVHKYVMLFAPEHFPWMMYS